MLPTHPRTDVQDRASSYGEQKPITRTHTHTLTNTRTHALRGNLHVCGVCMPPSSYPSPSAAAPKTSPRRKDGTFARGSNKQDAHTRLACQEITASIAKGVKEGDMAEGTLCLVQCTGGESPCTPLGMLGCRCEAHAARRYETYRVP